MNPFELERDLDINWLRDDATKSIDLTDEKIDCLLAVEFEPYLVQSLDYVNRARRSPKLIKDLISRERKKIHRTTGRYPSIQVLTANFIYLTMEEPLKDKSVQLLENGSHGSGVLWFDVSRGLNSSVDGIVGADLKKRGELGNYSLDGMLNYKAVIGDKFEIKDIMESQRELKAKADEAEKLLEEDKTGFSLIDLNYERTLQKLADPESKISTYTKSNPPIPQFFEAGAVLGLAVYKGMSEAIRSVPRQ